MNKENILEHKDELTYRQSTTAVVVNAENEILLVQKGNYADNEWDTPGGGCEEDELPEDAIERELLEETGSDQFEIIAKSRQVDRYEWPDSSILRKLEEKGETWRGQERTQFLAKFTGKKSDLKPQAGELKRIKWVKIEDLPSHLIFPGQWEKMSVLLKEFGVVSK